MKSKTSLKGILLLLATAFVWGTSFVAQSDGAEKIDAFTFQGIRTVLGGISLLPFVFLSFLSEQKYKNFLTAEQKKTDSKLLEIKKRAKNSVVYGIIQGCVLAVASNFQQFAFYHSSAGKIAFITAAYMFFVPLASLAIFHKKISFSTWTGIFLGFAGLYFISFSNGASLDSLNKGDLQAFICAIFFTCHIICIDKFSSKCDGIKLSCVQFFTAGFISCVLMLIFENPDFDSIRLSWASLLYSGIMSCGFAYTCQIFGQRRCDPSVGSLLMCMESVFALLSSAVLLGERLSAREILGCILMLLAILSVQISNIAKKD